MVDAQDRYWSKQATLNFDKESVDATIFVTEGGTPGVELDSEIPQDQEPDTFFDEVEGVTGDNEEVTLTNVIVTTGFDSGSGYKIRSIDRVFEAKIDGIGQNPFVDEDVEVTFDLLCFLPQYPIMNVGNDKSIISRTGWAATGEYAPDIDDRVEYIESRRRRLRTSKITLTQSDQNGPPEIQLKKAWERVSNILDLGSFILGVGCTPCRAVMEKDGEKFVKFNQTHRNIGSALNTNKLAFGDMPSLVDAGYDWYADDSRPDYKMPNIIGYYLDSINITRTVEGQLSTMFNGIELMAKRHSDYGPQYGSTVKRMENLVQELDVTVQDLAKSSKVFPDQYLNHSSETRSNKLLGRLLAKIRVPLKSTFLGNIIESYLIRDTPVPAYFFSKTRQYIVHGDNQSTFDGHFDRLVAEKEATKILMQRLIRNRIFGSLDSNTHPRLGDLEVNKYETFD